MAFVNLLSIPRPRECGDGEGCGGDHVSAGTFARGKLLGTVYAYVPDTDFFAEIDDYTAEVGEIFSFGDKQTVCTVHMHHILLQRRRWVKTENTHFGG
jgi:hypothetical protein